MKKTLKLFFISILAFLFTTLTANAKTMTYENFIKELEEYNSNIKEVYIIGKYAFTDINPLTTQDIMFASRSIDSQILGGTKKDPTFSKMVINYMSRKRTGMTYSDWTIGEPLVGTVGISKDSTFEIDYIDYNYISEDSEITDINLNITPYKDKLSNREFLNNTYSDNLTITSDDKINYKVEGLLFNKELENKPGYYMAFALNIPGLNENSTLTIKDASSNGYSKTFTKDDFVLTGTKGTAVIWNVNSKSTPKEIIITLDIDGSLNGYKETEYYITWDELKFQEDSKLNINLEFDKDSIKQELGYEKTQDDDYTLSALDEETKTYTLSGNVIYQEGPIKSFASTDPQGYYVLVNIFEESFIPGKTVLTIPCKSCENGTKEVLIDDSKSLSLLLALDSTKNTADYAITVDLDGTQNQYLPVTYHLAYNTDLHFKKKIELESVSINKDGINPDYNYNLDDLTSFTLNADYTLTGRVILTNTVTNTSLGNKNLTGYYLPLKLNLKETEYTIKVNGVVVTDDTLLLPLYPNKKETDEIVIEITKEKDQVEYIPITIKITYKELEFRQESSLQATLIDLDNLNFANWENNRQSGVTITPTSVDSKTKTISLNGNLYVQKANGKAYVVFSATAKKIGNYTPTIDIINNGLVVDSKITLIGAAYRKTFLFELPSDLTKLAIIRVDLDGEGNVYGPKDYTLEFKDLNVIKLFTLDFEGTEGYGNYQQMKCYADETPTVPNPTVSNKYLEFAHWENTTTNEIVDLTKPLTENLVVRPRINIKLDDYMKDYKTNFNAPGIEFESDSYNYKITNKNMPINSFTNTNLVAAINKIITDLKAPEVTINGTKVTKDNVSETLNSLIGDAKTYDDLVNNGFTITLTVTGDAEYKIDLADSKTYTFKFVSDFRVASTKEELLQFIDEKVATIYLAKDIDLGNEFLNINYEATIDGGNYTLTSSNDYVIATSSEVTINNLKLNGSDNATKGILVSSGSLATTGLEVTGLKTPSTDIIPVAIEVNDASASVVAKNLTFASETYDSPAIRALSGSSVTLTNNNNKSSEKTYQVLKKYEDSNNYFGDELINKENYNYKHYYANSKNESKWYKLTFESDKYVIRPPFNFYRYVEKSNIETNWASYSSTMLNANIKNLTKYNTDGVFFEVNDICTTSGSEQVCNLLTDLSKFPVPTGDTIYAIKLKQSSGVPEGIITVDNVNDLRNAVNSQKYYKIFLKEGEYDLGSEPLTISNTVTLNGTLGMVKGQKVPVSVIKGQIIVNSENVSLTQLVIRGQGNADNVITVNAKDFYLFQSELYIDDNSSFTNMIYYSIDLPKTDILFTKFDDSQNNLTSFIEFKGSVGTTDAEDEDDLKTEFLGNTFVGGTTMKSFIKIDTLDNSTHPLNLVLRQSTFTFKNEDSYAVEFVKTPTGDKEINIDFGYTYNKNSIESVPNVRVRINVTDDAYDTSSITIKKATKFTNFEIHYFKDNTDKGTTNPVDSSKDITVTDY